MIKVYFARYNKPLSESGFYEYLSLLPPGLQQKIISFKKWEDQHASLYSKLLLMKVLKEAEFNTDLLNLKYTNYGRPYLENTPDFNISHAGALAVCAISLQGTIGVDIEEIKPVFISDFKKQFSEEEWNHIVNSSDSTRWFYYYWTAKEAAIKANGAGLLLPLDKINIQNNQVKIGKISWFIKRVDIDNNYLLQIAVDKAINSEVTLSEVSF